MSNIETIIQNGKELFIGVIDYDNCKEVMENFEGEIKDNRYLVTISKDTLESLYTNNLIERGEKIAFENCDMLAFTGIK